MNEEIEYAEMLEIPVSTVNVVRKTRKRKKSESLSPIQNEESAIKDTVIANVNEKMSDEEKGLDADLFEEETNGEGAIDFDPVPERIDTVRLYSDNGESGELYPEDYELHDGGRYEMNRPSKAVRIALGIEFGLAGALCGAIFLTNVFLPGSAVNTFFRALNTPIKDAAKPYTDFTLASIVSELSDAELSLSPAGILSLTDDCQIYPAADGKVGEVTQNEEGLYTVKVNYSDSFTGVFSGLDTVYYAVGETVKTNVPIGYTAGETEVQVTMYSDGALLNCFELTEENCLAWISTELE
ncbi:MAG: hypothetical protein J6K86_02515 [Clostridia bacterium]|nr:hypothetical protein [Clostridia bacterium]